MADDLVSQDEVERLLAELTEGAAKPPAPVASATPTANVGLAAAPGVKTPVMVAAHPASSGGVADGNISQNDIDFLFGQAEKAIASIDSEQAPSIPPGAAPFALQEFGGAAASSETATLDLIRDVELDLRIELGRTHMHLEEVLKLCKGAVVPLDKMAGDPVDIYVNGRLIARGEVLVLNDNFCVRVAELVAGDASADAA